ncbi:MAG TPA: BlaI/MecI/CopY family transcriptional regulator [Acidobacteriota bacterium]|nr:BlaI/MecI/CopY family transcriptional regulator [Acidobacteriota bacterium]
MTESRRRLEGLGELEAAVMRVVWERGQVTVAETLRALQPERPLAYTTVMTVMSRLAEKRLLRRQKEGRSYVYQPALAQDEVAGSLLSSLVGRLYGGSSARAIAYLIEAESGADESELARLETLIRRKRGKLDR